ncbi:uncharacterized protein DDB_G0284459-like [Lutzomyia longipalpis]|uniref:uncharacterized protein DDB_G0284459-like n=1 Tax=Lutzomyia longipalpis TaxID=7200 RepID=UPI0024841C06|nr:uncharacterized protein DDB_G0284459-like [Lutzomyia longipalpis]
MEKELTIATRICAAKSTYCWEIRRQYVLVIRDRRTVKSSIVPDPLGEPTPKPQLDLPPLPPGTSTTEQPQPPPVPAPAGDPTILPNSYAGEPDEEGRSSRDYDSDRSQRYGPPYESDDAYYRDRNRYGDRPYDENYDTPVKYSKDDDRYYNYRGQGGYPGAGPYNNDDERYYNSRGRYPNPNPYSNDDDRYYKTNPYNDDRYRDDRYNDDRYRDDRYRDDRYRDDRYRDDRYRDDRYRDDRYGNDGYNRYDDPERKYQAANDRLSRYLAEIDQKSSDECFHNVAAQWNFETNVNEASQLEALTAQQRYSEFQRAIWDRMRFVDRSTIFDDHLYRQVNLMSIIGASALPPDQLDRVMKNF